MQMSPSSSDSCPSSSSKASKGKRKRTSSSKSDVATSKICTSWGEPNCWYIDSNTNEHLTNNLSNLLYAFKHEEGEMVYLRDGLGLPISHQGGFWFASPVTNRSLFMYNVLFVPSLTRNIISVSQFARDNDVYFQFDFNKCIVRERESNMLLFQASVDEDGLYRIHL